MAKEDSPELLAASERYLDRLFGPGAGKAHTRFLDGLDNAGLREALHRAHVRQDDESVLSVTEHYLIGMAVLCATKTWSAATMFAKTLRHLKVPAEKIFEATSRLSVWIGPVQAAEALGRIQKAVAEYDAKGLESMREWFPEGGEK
jgi:hypothetical protein